MDYRFQRLEFIGIVENDCCDGCSVQSSIVGNHIFSPSLDHCSKDRFARQLEFPNDRIGVDDNGPAYSQLIRHSRLPRTNSTGESY